jgi:glutathione-regulated potassium-efflux system protein KefB
MGKSSFSILLMQDLAVVPLLALVPILADTGNLTDGHAIWQQILIAISLILVLLGFGKYIIPKILDYLAINKNREAFFFSVILSVVFAAWAMEYAGLSMALGAFIMGMILSSSKYHYQIHANVEPYKGLLMTLFFVAVGMSIDLNAMMEDPIILIQHLFVIMGIKILILFLIMLFMGYTRSNAISVSFLLAQSGEFGFVLFGAAKALGVISDEMFVAAVTIISFSMLLTPLLVKISEKLSIKFDNTPIEIKSAYVPQEEWNGVFIVGYGRVGRLIATMLDHAKVPFIAFDIDVNRVEVGQKEGRAVYYGELDDFEFLSNIGLSRANAVIVTVDNHHSASKIVSHIRSLSPSLKILARTKNMKTRDALLTHGASWAMPESSEGSLRLGEETLLNLGMIKEDVNELLSYFRKDDYETIRKLYKGVNIED